MSNSGNWKVFLPALMLISTAIAADDVTNVTTAKKDAPPAEAAKPDAANRKTYDNLYSEILKTLPQDGKAKVDSAHGAEAKAKGQQAVKPKTPEDIQKTIADKRNQEMEALPPAVKARVDKALSDLDNRRKEKALEFKELEK